MAIARKPHVITDDEVEVNVVMGDVLIGLNG
jgi:hypothetical protein